MEIEAYLYDADGTDREVDLDLDILDSLNDKHLLWVNVLQRNREVIEHIGTVLQLKNIPFKSIMNISERPRLEKFPDFYRFFIVSVEFDKNHNLSLIPIDFIVGKNFVITIHEGYVKYYKEFIEGEKGETHLGELDAESFVVSLLDLHIVTYFRALEKIEQSVDKMDNRILKRDLEDEEFLREIVKLRSDVSRLRRWFLPHRDVFYALSRPDFLFDSLSGSTEDFQALNQHFENAVDTMDSSRDSVFGLFDLYTTRASHKMNNLMKSLTFATVIFGSLSVVVGAFGMNFAASFFQGESGFWWTLLGMGILVLSLIIIAKLKNWL